VIARRRSARCIADTPTRTPCAAAQASQCSASVASGAAATCARSAGASAGPIAGTAPGRGDGAKLPVRRCRRTHRCTVARPTANVRAATDCGIPSPTAPTTRSRRSTEYARISQVYDMHQLQSQRL
jgi:hypothetical protein